MAGELFKAMVSISVMHAPTAAASAMPHIARQLVVALVAAVTLFAGAARAALPTGTLEYVQRTGTVGATDDIAMWMRFTLSPGSSPLTFSSNPLTGFNPADLPASGLRFDPVTGTNIDVPFASIQSATIQSWYTYLQHHIFHRLRQRW